MTVFDSHAFVTLLCEFLKKQVVIRLFLITPVTVFVTRLCDTFL